MELVAPIAMMLFVALSHEAMHVIAILLLGGRFELVLIPSGLALFSVRADVRYPGVVAAVGVSSLPTVGMLLELLRVRRNVWLAFLSFSALDIVVNLFTGMGDGAYLSTPKLDPLSSAISFWMRIIAFNIFLYTFMLDVDDRILHSVGYQLSLLEELLNDKPKGWLRRSDVR